MSRGKPPGERGDDEQQSTRVLAARAAGLVRGLIGRLERLEKYCLATRTQELTATDELRRRVGALEVWCGEIQEQLAMGLDQQRQHSVQVGLSSRSGGDFAARSRQHLVRPGRGQEQFQEWEKALSLRDESAAALNAWEAIHGGTAAGAAAEPGGAVEAGGVGQREEPLEPTAARESADAEGGPGAGGAAAGGGAGPVEAAVTPQRAAWLEWRAAWAADNESSKTEP